MFFRQIVDPNPGPGAMQAGPGAGPGRPKWARYFENIKVQDSNHGHFAARII